MNVAIVGCGHGELDKMYETMHVIEKQRNVKIELLLVCGDFQACRNTTDLSNMACPAKYRHMNTFYKYYSGEKTAPVLTLYIGGNHEASNYHLELFHGGWVAPNIYFLGYAGLVNFGGLRIGGLSGIFKNNHFRLGHYECPPFSEDQKRSIYHVRELELYKLLQVSGNIDLFMSHDWPSGIAFHGNTEQLLRKKKFLRREVYDNSLGSPPAQRLMDNLHPRYWFSAHLHVKFPALKRHGDGKCTRFLALDKCLPNRDWMQVIHMPNGTGARVLKYDQEWLAIVRKTQYLLSVDRRAPYIPHVDDSANNNNNNNNNSNNKSMTNTNGNGHNTNSGKSMDNDVGKESETGSNTNRYAPTDAEKKWVKDRMQVKNGGSFDVPLNFKKTVPAHLEDTNTNTSNHHKSHNRNQHHNNRNDQNYNRCMVNPQSVQFHELLSIRDPISERFVHSYTPHHIDDPPIAPSSSSSSSSYGYNNRSSLSSSFSASHSRIVSSSLSSSTASQSLASGAGASLSAALSAINPDEIDLDDDDDDDDDDNDSDSDDKHESGGGKSSVQASTNTVVDTKNPDEIDLDIDDDDDDDDSDDDSDE